LCVLLAALFLTSVEDCVERQEGRGLLGAWLVEGVRFINPDGEVIVPDPQPGLFIFARSHYSAVWVPRSGARKPFATKFNPTTEELAEACLSIIANTGTYEATASLLTVHPIVTRMPEFAGGRAVYAYQLEEDRLTMEQLEEYLCDGARVPFRYRVRLSLRRLE
jgi:hypothetical protein